MSDENIKPKYPYIELRGIGGVSIRGEGANRVEEVGQPFVTNVPIDCLGDMTHINHLRSKGLAVIGYGNFPKTGKLAGEYAKIERAISELLNSPEARLAAAEKAAASGQAGRK